MDGWNFTVIIAFLNIFSDATHSFGLRFYLIVSLQKKLIFLGGEVFGINSRLISLIFLISAQISSL